MDLLALHVERQTRTIVAEAAAANAKAAKGTPSPGAKDETGTHASSTSCSSRCASSM